MSLRYSQETAVTRRMVRDMAIEDQPLMRARAAGVRSLSTAELLALVIQSPDALDLAREVIDKFGNLFGLFQCSTAELEAIRGVGAARANQIQAALELGRRATMPPNVEKITINNPMDAAAILIPEMGALKQEQVHVMLLDTRTRVIAVEMIYQGSLNTAVTRIAEIFRPAIVKSAAAIILAHNHPSQDSSPSPQDIEVTRSVAAVGDQLSITLLDHLIVTAGNFTSIKERGYF